MNDLTSRRSTPQNGPALARDAAEKLLRQLSGWTMNADAKEIRRTFTFKNY